MAYVKHPNLTGQLNATAPPVGFGAAADIAVVRTVARRIIQDSTIASGDRMVHLKDAAADGTKKRRVRLMQQLRLVRSAAAHEDLRHRVDHLHRLGSRFFRAQKPKSVRNWSRGGILCGQAVSLS